MSGAIDRLLAALADRYRIERELGQGGMATVYLAEDLKHKRKVALKVLKPELAAVLGADRFVQEITTTAGLQHPHILPLFDSGTADGFLYYVMPFIEGETLRDKLNRETQLSVDEAVRIAREVADALDYAHGKGVIHRDIKPENILIQNGRPMVADFGIALAVSAAAGGRMTETGLSLGTPHYMSPEQATADKEISGRSDVYSLASVLYEMLAGQPPHLGGSAQQIIMKIIAEPVDAVTRYRKSVPPNVTAALTKALEKLPADRFNSARSFADALANPAFAIRPAGTDAATAGDTSRMWKRATIATGALVVILGTALAASMRRDSAAVVPDRAPIRFGLSDDASLRIDGSFTNPYAVSPDGRSVVFRAATDTTTMQLWIRTLDSPTARPLAGTENGANAAFSGDGKWIAFITDLRVVKKVPASGGDVATVTAIEGLTAGLAWSADTLILIEQIGNADGMQRVNAAGGRAELAIPKDTAAKEIRQRRPLVLPGTDVVVYGSSTASGEETTIVMYRLTDGKRVRTGLTGHGALAMIDDRLIYAQSDGTLMAVAIDPRSMSVRGEPIRLTTRVAHGAPGTAVALSRSGVLVYRPGGAAAVSRLELVDMTGRSRTVHASSPFVGSPRFSRDGRRVAVAMAVDGGVSRNFRVTTADVWTIDLTNGEATRVTSNNEAGQPSWFPDGQRLLYVKAIGGGFEVHSHRLDGGSPSSRLLTLDDTPYAADVAADGRTLVVRTSYRNSTVQGALLRVSLGDDARVDTLITATVKLRPEYVRISPDGQWICFVDRSTYEVWVRSLRDSSTMMVSTTVSLDSPPVWGPDSRTLYYRSAAGMSMIELNTTPRLSVARRGVLRGLPTLGAFDMSPDGREFVMLAPTQRSGGAVIAVDWASEARREWSRSTKK
jgi:Tol biopolymer transport system component/tRNA A-37 threonylcarbamoyl transferase component Bud32